MSKPLLLLTTLLLVIGGAACSNNDVEEALREDVDAYHLAFYRLDNDQGFLLPL